MQGSVRTHSAWRSMDEDEIIKLAKQGNGPATEYLLRKYQGLVEAKAKSYFLMGAEREDVIQEGMIGLFKAIRDFSLYKFGGFRKFAALCVTRQIISAVKCASRQKHQALNSYVSMDASPPDADEDGLLEEVLTDESEHGPDAAVVGRELQRTVALEMERSLSDLERVRSQIADLRGERRGHVGVACSQALLPFFLPEQIAAYRAQHPAVTFDVRLRDREAAEAALAAHEADIAVVFEPVLGAEVATLMTAPQTVHAVMAADHPLAGHETVRLRDCLAHPVALPTPGTGVRRLLDAALARASHRAAAAVVSDSFEFLRSYARAEAAVTFQIPLGLAAPLTPGLVARPVDRRDLAPGLVHLCQLRGRTLPVAAARFSDQLARALATRFGAA